MALPTAHSFILKELKNNINSINEDFLKPSKIPAYQTKRGGQITYHGPGQRVIYLLIDLRNKEKDVNKT